MRVYGLTLFLPSLTEIFELSYYDQSCAVLWVMPYFGNYEITVAYYSIGLVIDLIYNCFHYILKINIHMGIKVVSLLFVASSLAFTLPGKIIDRLPCPTTCFLCTF